MARRSRRHRPRPARPKAPATPDAAQRPGSGPGWWAALFLAAFAIRLLFWRASADAAWPHTAYFKGDALLWLELADALRAGRPFELGLPIHPPGTGYLVWLLAGGGTPNPWVLKLTWCAMGALAVTLAAWAMERALGPGVGRIAGVLMAASTGLLMLSTSLNSEAPYLALVAASFCALAVTEDRPRLLPIALWAALGGIACLFRVEHALFVALALVFLGARWRRSPRPVASLAVALAAFTLPLIPWHVRAWAAIDRFNRAPPEAAAGPLREAAERLAGMPWDPEARARRDALPAFARETAATFVAATIAHRGGERVRAEDFGILQDAFGYEPRPVAARPFVSLYGPLNFALAQHPGAGAGFSAAALEEPPPLRPRPDAYPPELVHGLPPPQLALTYPPHLALFNEGYATGWRWTRSDPGRALRRLARKLDRFWAGAAMGLTGYGAPLGIEGTRYAVDVTVPDTDAISLGWRVLVFGGCILGAAVGRRRPGVGLWLLFLATKAAAAALFFGYARLGASAMPAMALLLALAIERAAAGRPALTAKAPGLALAALIVLASAEAVRFAQRPAFRLDGQAAGPRDPVPLDDHRDHRLGRVP
jgi:hypothetical protein